MEEQNNTSNDESSEWNEQMAFSKLYFKYTEKAREHQFDSLPLLWHRAVDCKLTQACGIFNDETKEKLLAKFRVMSKYFADLANLPENHPESKYKLMLLAEDLKLFEIELDSCVNKIMPFLKKKERPRFEDL